MRIDFENTEISTWFERDRAHVCLSKENGDTIVEWWDGAVREAINDGFLNARDWHRTAFEYAEQNGLLVTDIGPLSISPTPMGWAAELPEKGIYCGWRNGGSPIWSSDATEVEAAKGAYIFDSEDEAFEFFGPDDISVNVYEVELDLVAERMKRPSRASLGNCEMAGMQPLRKADGLAGPG